MRQHRLVGSEASENAGSHRRLVGSEASENAGSHRRLVGSEARENAGSPPTALTEERHPLIQDPRHGSDRPPAPYVVVTSPECWPEPLQPATEAVKVPLPDDPA